MRRIFINTLIFLLAALPLSINRRLGRLLGRLIMLFGSRFYQRTIINLQYCQPTLTDQARRQLTKKICLSCGETITESAWLWRRPYHQIEPKITHISGTELIDEAQANGQGVLLAGPHLGSWELLPLWSGSHYPTAAMYKEHKVIEMDAVLRFGRNRTGTRLITGLARNTRELLATLKRKEILIVLPDQDPGAGAGVFAPFFAKPAFTMTLIQRLQQKTDAKVLMFHVQRTAQGFSLSISDPMLNQPDMPKEAYAEALNQALEQLILSNMPQYQWGYKRFKTIPEGQQSIY